MNHLSQELNRILREKGIRPADVARDLEVPESLLSRIINGKNLISRDSLEKILSFFKDPLDSARLLRPT